MCHFGPVFIRPSQWSITASNFQCLSKYKSPEVHIQKTLSQVLPLLLAGLVFSLEDSSKDEGFSNSSGALESKNSSFHNFCRPLEDYGPRLSCLLHANKKVDDLNSTTTFKDQLILRVLGSSVRRVHPIKSYYGRTDVLEERRICETKLVKSCQPVTVTDCMQVSELRCEVVAMIYVI